MDTATPAENGHTAGPHDPTHLFDTSGQDSAPAGDDASTPEEGVETWPRPDERRKGLVQGIPLKMGDGQEWLLAEGGIAPTLTAIRDSLYDSMVVSRQVGVNDVFQAAWALLTANYDLTDNEAARLIFSADQGELVGATLEALFGPEKPRRGWTEWATTALLANNLDPTKIPAKALHAVLSHLVLTGRAAPEFEFVGSAIWAATRSKLGSMTAGGR